MKLHTLLSLSLLFVLPGCKLWDKEKKDDVKVESEKKQVKEEAEKVVVEDDNQLGELADKNKSLGIMADNEDLEADTLTKPTENVSEEQDHTEVLKEAEKAEDVAVAVMDESKEKVEALEHNKEARELTDPLTNDDGKKKE